MTGIIIAIVALIGAGVGAYFIFIKKKSPSIPITPAPTGWQFQYSSNTNGSPEDFDFPLKDGVHYCIKPAPSGIGLGQTITMNFTISGAGALSVADPGDSLPATVRLYLQGKSGVNDRWFQHSGTNLVVGDSTVTLQLVEENWGGVGGGTVQPTSFATSIANLQNVGFTFGGQYFAGHGVYATGPVHFHLNQFTII